MIFTDALKSLKNNLGRAIFYWLTFVLTSMFIFLFFNISMSDAIGVTFIDSKSDLATTITIFVVIICMIIIFFANDFFVKNKAKDLAIRLVCGATYTQLVAYLLIQTFMMLLTAIPVGIVGALFSIPFINQAFTTYLSNPFMISVHFDAVFVTTLVLVFVVFWTTYLNLSFAYRNSAAMLLNERLMANPFNASVKKKKVTIADFDFSPDTDFKSIALGQGVKQETVVEEVVQEEKTSNWKIYFFLGLYLLPIIVFYLKQELIFLFSLVGLIGFNSCLKHIIMPKIDAYVQEKKIDDPEALISVGFVRSDIQILRYNIMLFLVCSILLISIVVEQESLPLETMLALLSYVVMNMLLSLAIMFQFSTEIYNRRKAFRSLAQIGFLEEQLDRIMKKECFYFYAFILIASLVYILNIFFALMINGKINIQFACILFIFLVIPLCICAWISYIQYKKTVFPKRK